MSLKKELRFITFEGIIGSGKSTQSNILYNYLTNNGKKVILTREIGGSNLAEKIRNIFINNNIPSISQIFLVLAARYDHLHKVIFPALLSDHIVICDRFIDSTLAYHQNNLLNFDQILEFHKNFAKLNYQDLNQNSDRSYNPDLVKKYINCALMPDITFLLNIEHSEALFRAQTRDIQNQDNKNQNYYNIIDKIQKNFLKLQKQFKSRIHKIDCDQQNPTNS
ncbi:MAG: dTMP kinase [Rickettsia sp.]|nr:dTMP kinase [Rickettsia sp.]